MPATTSALRRAARRAPAGAVTGLWTFPTLVFSAFLLAWGAEAAQFVFSQGLSLAILAWLQTLPEFAVEAVIAWDQNVPLMTANFTGSLRPGRVGWPLIYFTAAISAQHRQRRARKTGTPTRAFFDPIHLDKEHAVEVMGLIPPLVYFWVILLKGTLNMIDSVFLIMAYLAYLIVAKNLPAKENDGTHELPRVTKRVLCFSGWRRPASIVLLFLVGGAGIMFVASLPAQHARPCRDPGGLPVCVRAVGRAVPVRVPREAERLLLGEDRQEGTDGLHEHGFIQHQPVDHPRRDDPDCVQSEPRRLFDDSL
jgi:Ca2+/Na+ antiporter